MLPVTTDDNIFTIMIALNPHDLSAFARVSVRCGFDLDALLREIDAEGYEISPAAGYPDILVLQRLYALAVARSHGEHFPFALGGSFAFEHAPEVVSYLATCATLRQALPLLDHMPLLLHPELVVRYAVDSTHLRVSFEFYRELRRLEIPGYIETFHTAFMRFVESLISEAIEVEMSFRHAPLTSMEIYERQFRHRPRFGSACNELALARDDLDRPLKNRSPILHAKAQLLMERRLQRLQSESGLLKTLQMMLTQQPAMSIADACTRLGVGERQLQRLLRRDGTSFLDLQAHARAEQACVLLRDRALSLEDIALKLGFVDRGGFSRAFTKWKGMPPARFRRESLR